MTGKLEPYDLLTGPSLRAVRTFWSQCPGSLFQHPSWLDVIKRCYGLRSWLFLAEHEGNLQGIVPLVRIRNKYISLPFLDYTAPICRDGHGEKVLGRLVRFMADHSFRVQLRCREGFRIDGLPVDSSQSTMRLSLAASEERAWKGFTAKVRNQVRKPEKAGIIVKDGVSALPDFYRIWAEHISGLGTPVHPQSLFAAIFDLFSAERAHLLTAWKNRDVVGGLVLLFDDDCAYVPWAAVQSDYKSLCVNHALYWHAIRLAIGTGKRAFDFLRSQRGSGTYRFKAQWGAAETPLDYFDSDGAGNPKSSKGMKVASRIWKKLPVSLSVRLGPRIRKYIP